MDALRELALLGDQLYRPFDSPKKNGKGTRRIDNPSQRLKVVQAKIYERILKVIPFRRSFLEVSWGGPCGTMPSNMSGSLGLLG